MRPGSMKKITHPGILSAIKVIKKQGFRLRSATSSDADANFHPPGSGITMTSIKQRGPSHRSKGEALITPTPALARCHTDFSADRLSRGDADLLHP